MPKYREEVRGGSDATTLSPIGAPQPEEGTLSKCSKITKRNHSSTIICSKTCFFFALTYTLTISLLQIFWLNKLTFTLLPWLLIPPFYTSHSSRLQFLGKSLKLRFTSINNTEILPLAFGSFWLLWNLLMMVVGVGGKDKARGIKIFSWQWPQGLTLAGMPVTVINANRYQRM